jgi:hypothetical protein
MRLRTVAVLVMTALIVAACGEPPGDEEIDFDGTQRPPVPAEATSADQLDDDAETDDDDMAVDTDEDIEAEATVEPFEQDDQASSDEYDSVTLYLGEVNVLANSDVSASGELAVTISFENTGERTVELPFTRESYQLLDDNGLPATPSTLDDTLINPTIESGESVSGTLRYALTDSMTTFTLNVGSFGRLVVDGNLDPETRP